MHDTIVWQKCVVVDIDTKQCLVLQRSNYKKDGGKRDMVWWSVDFGEDVSVAIAREALEEAWIILDSIRPIHVYSKLFDDSERFFVFVLRVCDKRHFTHDWVLLSNEHIAYDWVNARTLSTLEFRDTVSTVLPYINNYLLSL